MRKLALSLFVLWTLILAGGPNKPAKVKQLQDQYNAEYPAYAKEYNDPATSGSSELLTGEKLTPGADGGCGSQEERTRRAV